MCLIAVSWQQFAEYPLVLLSNRDEFYGRPTRALAHWPDSEPAIFAGQDLEQGGTWMGITAQGRFAAVTNYRDPSRRVQAALSRGWLVSDYLKSPLDPAQWLQRLEPDAAGYGGFNLLVGTPTELWYFSNLELEAQRLAPGLYGLSNHLLDTPWPKVEALKQALAGQLAQPGWNPSELLDLLGDRQVAPDTALPDTGVGLALERQLSPRFIQLEKYGTRASSLLYLRAQQLTFIERTWPTGTEQTVTLPLS